jgi:hypothetical protein
MKKVMKRKVHREGTGKGTALFRSRVSEKARRGIKVERLPTSDVTYEIVQHDGGWAYKVDGVFSEAFPTHAEALAAAQSAAAEQELPGDAETIEYEDEKGEWHSETVSGRDRPHAVVKDTNT